MFGFRRLVAGVGRAEAEAALAEVGAEQVLNSPLQAISGGELQRVLLARALLRKPQLLVLGRHGRSALSQALLGSLAQHYLHKAPCDVFVVR